MAGRNEKERDFVIRLIIVEDESVIRNGICRHMKWEELEVDEVRTAANAEEAMQICENFLPDIILSDIRMPGMSGIELCTAFRQRLPKAQIIFISGFSDKEYLMSAISLGAVSYVEKPIAIEKLSEAVRKAVETVHMLRSQEKNVLHTLMSPEQNKQEAAVALFKGMMNGREVSEASHFVILHLKFQKEAGSMEEWMEGFSERLKQIGEQEETHILYDYLTKQRMLLLLAMKAEHKKLTEGSLPVKLLALFSDLSPCFLGAGDPVTSLEELPASYDSAEKALGCLAYKGWNDWGDSSDTGNEYEERLSQKRQNTFYKLLVEKKLPESMDFLEEIYRELTEAHAILNFPVRAVYYLLNDLVSQAERSLSLKSLVGAQKEDGHLFLDSAETIRELNDYVADHIRQILEEGDEEQKTNFIIKKAVAFLNENLDKRELSLQVLADIVYLTPTYLSTLFKKKTGATVNQFLTELRMKRAEQLLRDPKLKLYQIASMVGYEDANYFAKLFKKQTGMLPSEFREKLL